MNDRTFDALANEQRRDVLIELLQETTSSGPGDQSTDGGQDVEHDEDRGSVELVHVHLPKLDHYDFIDWDRQADEIAKGARFDEVRPVVELLTEQTDE